MRKKIGYYEQSYEHNPTRELINIDRFDGLSPRGFFYDRVGLLERFIEHLGGNLLRADTRCLNALRDKPPLKIGAYEERTAEFQIPEEGSLTLVDYTTPAYFGSDYKGIITLDFKDENPDIARGIEDFCKVIFPINDHILQYLE